MRSPSVHRRLFVCLVVLCIGVTSASAGGRSGSVTVSGVTVTVQYGSTESGGYSYINYVYFNVQHSRSTAPVNVCYAIDFYSQGSLIKTIGDDFTCRGDNFASTGMSWYGFQDINRPALRTGSSYIEVRVRVNTFFSPKPQMGKIDLPV
jgi:hypothetical protein